MSCNAFAPACMSSPAGRACSASFTADDADDDEYVDPDDLDSQGQPLIGGGESKKVAVAAKASAAGSCSSKRRLVVAGLRVKGGCWWTRTCPAWVCTVQGVAGCALLLPHPHPATAVSGMLLSYCSPPSLPPLAAPRGEQACRDLHEKCSGWAASGECEANPNYMIGSKSNTGHCRRACGMCSPSHMLAQPAALKDEAESLAAALLLAAKNLGCGASRACLTGVTGTAFGSGISVIKSGSQQPKKHPPGITEFPGGFILGRPTYGVPVVKRVKHERPPGLTAAPEGADGGGGDGGGDSVALAREVERVLWDALGGKLLSIPSEFFIYEFLYRNHTRQYHKEVGTGSNTGARLQAHARADHSSANLCYRDECTSGA